MSAIQRFLENMKRKQQERIDIDDDKTTNLTLRSFRRQVRRQDEEAEMKMLKDKIRAFELIKTRELVLGEKFEDGTHVIKKEIIKKKISEKKQFLSKNIFIKANKNTKKTILGKGFI